MFFHNVDIRSSLSITDNAGRSLQLTTFIVYIPPSDYQVGITAASNESVILLDEGKKAHFVTFTRWLHEKEEFYIFTDDLKKEASCHRANEVFDNLNKILKTNMYQIFVSYSYIIR